MKRKLRTPRRALGLGLVAAAVAVAAVTATSVAHAAGSNSGHYSVHPQISAPQSMQSGVADAFACQKRPIDGSSGRARCYTPQQMQQAYGLTGLLASGVDGSGKTIVIIDAFSSPTIVTDLQDFDRDMGLPAPSFTITQVGTVPPFDIDNDDMVGWAQEISLDVQWAHAMAPGAAIDLVEAASDSDADIFAATKYAIDHKLGDVISQSFGEAESCVDPKLLRQEHALFAKATHEGMTLFAISGDSGASQLDCTGENAVEGVSSPASDPSVTGVGGTTLNATDDPDGTATQPSGTYLGETAWTEPLFGCNPPALDFPFDVNCSGGGFSTIYRQPVWQTPLVQKVAPQGHPPARGVPDVAYDAGVNGGVTVHIGFLLTQLGFGQDDPLYFVMGGTSAGSPQWAGLIADADQIAKHDLGNINDDLYWLARNKRAYGGDFHDITTGNNDVAEIGGNGFNAGPGWDPVTGLGTPNAANLLPALAKSGPH